MIVIHAYTLMGELHVSCTTTRGSVKSPDGRVIMQLLDAGTYDVAGDHAPVDLVQAFCQMVDNIEHATQGQLYDHLEA